MNILLVTMEMQVGGAETHIFELARELKKRNHQVLVMSAGGKYAEMLEKEHITHIEAPLKDKKISHMIQAYQIMKKAMTDYHIDIVHAHARIPGFIASKACQKLNIPFVTTVHGIYKVNFILKRLTNWGQKSLAVSEDIKNQIIKDYQYNPRDIGVTVNGINTEDFCKGTSEKLPKELGMESNKFCIVHVSRLDRASSNIAEMLIHLFEKLKEETQNKVQLVLVGDGNYFEEIKAEANRNPDIILTGLRTDVSEILKSSDMFVGVSRAALEAMACELPVVLAGNRDYAQGFIGIFDETEKERAISTNFCCRECKEVTEEDLVKSILKLYHMSQEQRNALGTYGRQVVRKYYSIEKMANDAENMYQSALGNLSKKS